MKTLAIAAVASVLGITGAMAQTTIIRGDRDDGFRAGVSVREHGMRDRDRRVVVHRRDTFRTGSVEGCRTIIVKRTNDMGDRVVKKIRKCG